MQPLTLNIGEGLELRTLRDIDSETLFHVVDFNRDYLGRWLDFVDSYNSVSAAEQFIQRFRERAGRSEGTAFGIWLEGSLTGVITYDRIDRIARSALVGYWLAEKYQKRGIATRACEALVDYAFDVLGLKIVEIRCAIGNIRCRAVPERLGFKQARVIKDDEWLHDHYEDSVVYALEVKNTGRAAR